MRRSLLLLLPAAALALPVVNAVNAGAPNEGVCDNLSTGHLPGDGDGSVTFTAPAGFLIVTYCVKAGSIVQGDGPEDYNVNPAVQTVTITHSSGKNISHFSVLYKPGTLPTTTTTSSSTTTSTTTTVADTTTTTTTEPEVTTSTTTTAPEDTTTTSTTSSVPGSTTSTTDVSTTTDPTTTVPETSTSEVTTTTEPEVTTTTPSQPRLPQTR